MEECNQREAGDEDVVGDIEVETEDHGEGAGGRGYNLKICSRVMMLWETVR